MKLLLMFNVLFSFVLCVNTFAQDLNNIETDSHKIIVKQGLELRFFQNDKRLKMKDMVGVMKQNNEAYMLMKKAKSHKTISTILSIPSAAFFGYYSGQALFGGDANVPVLLFSGGVFFTSMGYSISYSTKAKKAVKIYNSELTYCPQEMQFNFGLTSNGIGLSINF